ncbi:MAG: rod shape-determining protein MreD [Candidatus Cloacimonas sp.]
MVWKGIWSYILGFFFLYLQILVMPALAVFGVIPNILLPWLIYIVWTRQRNFAVILVFIIGMMFDTVNPMTFGFYAFIFLLLAVAIDEFRKPFEPESFVAKMLTIGIANLLFSLIQLIIYGVTFSFAAPLPAKALIGFGYNVILSMAVFWSMQLLSKIRLTINND